MHTQSYTHMAQATHMVPYMRGCRNNGRHDDDRAECKNVLCCREVARSEADDEQYSTGIFHSGTFERLFGICCTFETRAHLLVERMLYQHTHTSRTSQMENACIYLGALVVWLN